MHNPHPSEAGSRHERVFNLPPVVIAISVLCFLAYVVPVYFLSYEEAEMFFASFGFVPALFATGHSLMAGLSVVTYSFLHGSWAHLGFNMVWFVIFGSPLACRLGAFFFLLFWIFTAIIAALTHFIFYPESMTILVGASGAISGLMGAAARYGFRSVPERYLSGFTGPILPVHVALRSRTVLVFAGGWLLLNLLTGVMSQSSGARITPIAWEAHIGGLLAGFLIISFFDRHPFSLR